MRIVTTIIVGILTAILVGAIMAFPIKLLWNWALVPAVNGINYIGLKQAWGIMVLASLLFRNISTDKKD